MEKLTPTDPLMVLTSRSLRMLDGQHLSNDVIASELEAAVKIMTADGIIGYWQIMAAFEGDVAVIDRIKAEITRLENLEPQDYEAYGREVVALFRTRIAKLRSGTQDRPRLRVVR